MTYVEGDVASGGTESGRPPIKIGGVYRSTKPTFTDGQRVEAQFGTRGSLLVQVAGADGANSVSSDANSSDAHGTLTTLAVSSYPYLWNGATWDRARTPNVIKVVAAVALTAGTGATIWTPAGGKKFRLMGWALSVSAGASLIFGDNLVATVILRTELLAAAGISQNAPEFSNGFLSAAANNVLKLDVTVTATVSGYVYGTEE